MTTLQLLSLLISIAALFGWISSRWLKLPITIGTMLLTVGCSLCLVSISAYVPDLQPWAVRLVQQIDFESLILHGMLALLLFAGAFLLDLEFLIREKLAVAVLSVVGTLLSTIAIAALMWWALSLIGIPATWLQCLFFGALISPTDPIAAAFVMQTIADIRPSNSVIVEEAPSHKLALQRHLPINNNAFYSVASGGLGYGLAAAAGIALADPSRHVICIVGDGSAMYSIQALWTAAHHRLPITYVVLNNGGYGALRAFSQLMKFEDIPGIDLPSLDFVALALGHGCNACRVSRAADIEMTLHRAFANSSPSLVEVVVDRTVPSLFTTD